MKWTAAIILLPLCACVTLGDRPLPFYTAAQLINISDQWITPEVLDGRIERFSDEDMAAPLPVGVAEIEGYLSPSGGYYELHQGENGVCPGRSRVIVVHLRRSEQNTDALSKINTRHTNIHVIIRGRITNRYDPADSISIFNTSDGRYIGPIIDADIVSVDDQFC